MRGIGIMLFSSCCSVRGKKLLHEGQIIYRQLPPPNFYYCWSQPPHRKALVTMPSVALLEREIIEIWALPSKGQSWNRVQASRWPWWFFLLSSFLMPQIKLPGKNDTVKCILTVYPYVIHSTNIYWVLTRGNHWAARSWGSQGPNDALFSPWHVGQ